MNRTKFQKTVVHTAVRVLTMILIVSPVLGVLTGSGSAASDSAIAAPDEPPFQGEPMTPLQTELAEAISQRHAAGESGR